MVMISVHSLQQHSNTLTTTNACGPNGVVHVPPSHLMDEVSSDPGPRSSQGVAQCYSSSINIGPLTIQSQLFLNREKLGSKGFIHLHTTSHYCVCAWYKTVLEAEQKFMLLLVIISESR